MLASDFKIREIVKGVGGIKKVSPQDQLGKTINILESTHEPAFVFDKSEKFLGLITIKENLYKKRLPLASKVGGHLYYPAKLTKNSSVFETIKEMAESKLYLLPVFENEILIGLISARDIVKKIVADLRVRKRIAENISIHKVITINEMEPAKKAYAMLKDYGISRLVLTDSAGKTSGVISRKDLARLFFSPSGKQRFSTRGGNPANYSFDVNKILKRNDHIKTLAKFDVFSEDIGKGIEEITKKLINSRYNSIVVEENNLPVGILTIKDLLLSILKLQEVELPKVIYTIHHQISEALRKELVKMVEEFAAKSNKKNPLINTQLVLKTAKSPEGKNSEYDFKISIFTKKGELFFAESKNRDPKIGLKECISKINKQLRRG